MIQVNDLKKNYGKNEVLKGVSFSVEENEIFGLLGPNGAGKTTTLECIEGLRRYDSGSITICGKSPQKASSEHLTGVQLQSSSLPSGINVKDAMTLFCTWNGISPRMDLLETFGLSGMLTKTYKEMSTGQKRKLHLALALSHKPKVLFLDEPTAGLDVQARVSLHSEIKKLKQQGVTIILASHDMAEVASLCDRIGILVKGKICKIGTPDEIVLEVKRETIIKVKVQGKIYSNNFSTLVPVNELNGYYSFKTDNILDGLGDLIVYIKQEKLDLLDLVVDKPTLEERYVEITKEDE